MHGSMGTSCAVADVQGDKATIWSPTQSAYPTRSGVGDAARRCRPTTCASIFTRGSGCYGINGADTVSYDAALLSQAVGKPVRVQLSRKDEMAWENYGFAYVIDQRVGLDADGDDRRVGLRGVVRRRSAAGPATTRPGNVVTGMLAGLRAGAVRAADAGAATRRPFNNGSNAAPSYVTGLRRRRAAAARARSRASAC